MRALFAWIFCFVILAITQVYQQRPDVHFAVPSATEIASIPWPLVALQAVALLVGIGFGYFHKRLTDLRAQGVESVDIGKEIRLMGRSTHFLLALTAAPLVFGVVVVLTGNLPALTSIFIAFQNGFFWEKVLPQKPIALDGATPISAEPAQNARSSKAPARRRSARSG